MAFDAQTLWDLSGPITMPAMSDDDFMMLLEKQMQAAHPTTNVQHQSMVAPPAVMAPPQPADTLTPPLTDESSPSPPASAGDTSKRKAGDDDDGQPRAKVQHKANDDGVHSQPQDDTSKKPPTRRKSGGNTSISDEGRLAKRKEQNRAAQRAFRDRKEKHVRDLEDKIQELEQKYATSESENTNLKDLLRRLQSENMMLKQSAFTFEFNPTEKPNHQATSPTANTASSHSSGGTNPFTSPSHSGSSASPESSTSNYVSKSPNNSLFNTPSPNINAQPESQELVTVNPAGFLAFSNQTTVTQPTPATPALAMSSPGAGPSSISQNAFNQNSLFTSYRDPTSYSLGLPFGDFNTLTAPNVAAEFGMDFGMDMTMGNDLGAFGLGSDFDDLFGGQLGALDGTNSYGGVGSSATSPATTNLMTPQSASISTPPQSGSASTPQSATATPASQQIIIDGLPSVGESARVECSIKAPGPNDWRRCPKTRQDFVDLVRNDTTQPSTFGPPLNSEDKANIEEEWQQFRQRPGFQEPDMDKLCNELFDKAQCTELKTRMKQSMMRIAKDLANGPPPA